MKRQIALALLFLAILACGSVIGQEKPWFDPNICVMCKQLADQPGLNQHMHREYHGISNGMLALTHVDTGYEEAFGKAQTAMREVVSEAMANGGQMPMCGFCSKFRDFAMAGIFPEVIHTSDGVAVLYMTKDSTKVKELQQFAIKAQEETAKLAGATQK
jgi:hypothetical protein